MLACLLFSFFFSFLIQVHQPDSRPRKNPDGLFMDGSGKETRTDHTTQPNRSSKQPDTFISLFTFGRYQKPLFLSSLSLSLSSFLNLRPRPSPAHLRPHPFPRGVCNSTNKTSQDRTGQEKIVPLVRMPILYSAISSFLFIREGVGGQEKSFFWNAVADERQARREADWNAEGEADAVLIPFFLLLD